MYIAKVLVTIAPGDFVPTNGFISPSNNVRATLSPPEDISGTPSPGVFTGNGEAIIITTPPGYTGYAQILFQLPDPNYVLGGLVFVPQPEESSRLAFPSVVVNRDTAGSQLLVTDMIEAATGAIAFTYGILVQRTLDGALGVIDPRMINDPR